MQLISEFTLTNRLQDVAYAISVVCFSEVANASLGAGMEGAQRESLSLGSSRGHIRRRYISKLRSEYSGSTFFVHLTE